MYARFYDYVYLQNMLVQKFIKISYNAFPKEDFLLQNHFKCNESILMLRQSIQGKTLKIFIYV